MTDVKIEQGFLPAKDGLTLFWTSTAPAAPRAAIALVHGYGEHVGRYRELIAFLAGRGYAVYALDVRGHGQSGGKRACVDAFQQYLDDLETFLAFVRGRTAGKKLLGVAHSNGALIFARYLLGKPDAVDAIALSSPYFALGFKPPAWKLAASRLMGSLLPAMKIPAGVAYSQLTSDEAIQKATAADPQYLTFATPRWFNESTAAQAEVLRRATEFVTPLLVMPGEADTVADPKAAKAFFEGATATDKRYVGWPGLRHEIFNEVRRAEVFEALAGWLDAHCGEGAGAEAAKA